MYDIIRENLKWAILGLSIIWIFGSMASCKKTNYKESAKIDIIAIENGYVQKKITGGSIIWTKPNEPTIINESE